MNRRMKEEQESFDSGHVTTSIRKEGEKEIVMGGMNEGGKG